MKIGILTIQDSKNYGANLQSYALVTYLNGIKNVSAELIDLRRLEHMDFKKSKKYKILYFSKKFYNKEKLTFFDRLYIYSRRTVRKILSLFTKGFYKFYFNVNFCSEIKKRDFKFFLFFKKCKISKRFYCIDELYQEPPEYDVFIVGSDQVWNPYNNYNVEPFFLTFTSCKNKYTYASSIGTSEIGDFLLKNYAVWLKDFTCVSVREDSAKRTLNKVGVSNIREDVDPTFLLNPEEWKRIASPCLLNEKYLFLFALTFSNDIFENAKVIADNCNLKIICIAKDENDYSFLKSKLKKDDILINIGIEDWLSLILHSECVVTDSFHGTVFSMFLSKKFFTYIGLTNTKGERIKNILNMFNLKEHLINEEFIKMLPEKLSIKNTFDYSSYIDIINNSKDYLGNICNDC